MSKPNEQSNAYNSNTSNTESEHHTHHSGSGSSSSASQSGHSSSHHYHSGSGSSHSSSRHHSGSDESRSSSSHHSDSGSSHSASHHASGSSASRSASGHSGHESEHASESHHHSRQPSADKEKRDALIQKYQIVADDGMPTDTVSQKHRHHHRKHISRRRKIKRILIALVSIPLALVLIAASAFGVLNVIGKKQLQKDTGGVETNPFSVTYDEGKTVEYDGKIYALNEDIVTVAAIGMDREQFGLEDNKIGTAGQADFILIVAMDLHSGQVTPVMIPRDTMVDVDQFTTDGQYVGVKNMQICLSFAYGDGGATSSRNVLTSAQRVLYGIPVHLYGVLDLSGIPALNDAVGGVRVTLAEDFSDKKAGEQLTLHGMEAEKFVRSRDTTRMDSDAPRRARQIQYLTAFTEKVTSAAIRDLSVIRSLYSTAMEYAFTNVSLSRATYLATTLLQKGISFADVTTLSGELKPGDPYAEYILDEQAAFETVLNVFYTQTGVK